MKRLVGLYVRKQAGEKAVTKDPPFKGRVFAVTNPMQGGNQYYHP